MRDFSEIEQDIATVLDLLAGQLSDKASSWVRENSELHGEYGIALESLLWSIDEEKIAPPPTAVRVLRRLADSMPIEPEYRALLQRLGHDE